MSCVKRESPTHVKAREDLFQRESLVFPGKRDSLAGQRDLKKATTGTQGKVRTVTKRDNSAILQKADSTCQQVGNLTNG